MSQCQTDRHSTMVTLAQRQILEDFSFHLFGMNRAICSEIYQSPDDRGLRQLFLQLFKSLPTSEACRLMSAIGTKQTSMPTLSMSALRG